MVPTHPTLDRISTPTLVETAAQSLREAILDGRFAPGQRLLEPRLALALGISRGPLREALQVLERDGIVASTPRRGRIVQVIDASTIDEVYSLRTILESFAVERAIAQASEDSLASLDEALDRIREAADAGDAKAVAERDIEFHAILYDLSGHKLLRRAWQELFAGKLQVWIRVTTGTHTPLSEPYQNHAAIVSAIRARDTGLARSEVIAHVADARARALVSLKEGVAVARSSRRSNGSATPARVLDRTSSARRADLSTKMAR